MILASLAAAVQLLVGGVSLQAPTIGVDASLVAVGFVEEGRYAGQMEVPTDVQTIGWYKYGGSFGAGNTVLAGHISKPGERGVFYNLKDLELGDPVTVGVLSNVLSYTVTRVATYPKTGFPAEEVFIGDALSAEHGTVLAPVLVLVTCGGVFDQGARSYEDNVIVWLEADDG